jgi:phage terminase large subunit
MDARLLRLSREVANLTAAATPAVVGPVVDAATGEILLPGDPAGRPFRVYFVPADLCFDQTGRLRPTTDLWRGLGIAADWDAAVPEMAIGELPEADAYVGGKFRPLFTKHGFRWLGLHGGRGSGKSTTVCLALLLHARSKRTRIAALREFQTSIAGSVKQLLSDLIDLHGWHEEFAETLTAIEHRNGSRVTFHGLATNVDSVRSLEKVDIFAIEEAASISARSLETLAPTVRAEGSFAIAAWNPEKPEDPVDSLLRQEPPPGSWVQSVGIGDNPYFFRTALPPDMGHLLHHDRDLGSHIWLGGYRSASAARIFRNVEIGWRPEGLEYRMYLGFDPSNGGASPAAAVEVHVSIAARTIFIATEAYGHPTLTELKSFLDPFEWTMRKEILWVDSARPDIIENLNAIGMPARAVRKSPGSIRTGIDHLLGFRIIVSPKCPHMWREFQEYSWAVDRKTLRPTDTPTGPDHLVDAVRYAIHELVERPDNSSDGGVFRIKMGKW